MFLSEKFFYNFGIYDRNDELKDWFDEYLAGNGGWGASLSIDIPLGDIILFQKVKSRFSFASSSFLYMILSSVFKLFIGLW